MWERLPWFCYLVTNFCLILLLTYGRDHPGSSVHGVSLARILEWIAISLPRGSSPLRKSNWVSCITSWVLYCWTSSVTLICDGVNFIPTTFNVCFELPISHILPSRTCRNSTENWRERGADQSAIGSHNVNWLISLVKVCVHTCVPTLSGWDSIRQESAKNMRLWFCYKN